MIDTNEIRRRLDTVWSRFKASGVDSDFKIIEHIAALLLDPLARTLSEELRPQFPTYKNLDVSTIQKELEDTANLLPSSNAKADLFDPYVLFRLSDDLGKGQFPIPRYLVDMMLALARVESEHTLADFTCGSGGFFVRRKRNQEGPMGKSIGIEIDANWARIANANILLHKLDVHIENDDAIRVALQNGPFAKETFERIMMAPSFGKSINRKLVQQAFNQDIPGSSNIVFPWLALDKLSLNGYATIIVPTSFLMRNSAGVSQLRQKLLEGYQLEAAIFLPENALKPFSNLSTSLLVVHKLKPNETSSTWFFNAVNDGYPPDRYVAFTTDPQPVNDLSFATQVVLQSTSFKPSFTLSTKDKAEPMLEGQIIRNNGITLGTVLKCSDDKKISSVVFHEFDQQRILLIEVLYMNQYFTGAINLTSLHSELIESSEEFLCHFYGIEYKKGVSLPQGKQIFTYGIPGQRLAITLDGHLRGISLPQQGLKANITLPSLIPLEYLYLLEGTEHASLVSPAALLASVHRDQRRLSRRIDNFAGRLELTPIAGQTIPSPLPSRTRGEERPPRLLETEFNNKFFSERQQSVWENVRQQTFKMNDNDFTALYFTADTVQAFDKANTQQTLELLEHMGLIVQVTILENGKPTAYYRRVTQRDIWELPPEEGNK